MGNKYLRDLIEPHPHLWKPIIPPPLFSSYPCPLGALFNVQKISLFSFFSKICSQQTARVCSLQEDSYACKTCPSVLQNKVLGLDEKGRMRKQKYENDIDHCCAWKNDKFPHKSSFALCVIGKQGGN